MELSVLNAIFLAVPQAMLFVDNTGQNAWVNTKAAELLQVDSIEPEPLQIAEAMRTLRERTANRAEIERHWQAAMHDPTEPILHWLWLFPEDCSPKALEVSCVPAVSNNMKGRLWVFQDISELYLAQDLLRTINGELSHKNRELKEQSELLAAAQQDIEQQMEVQQEQTNLIEIANSALEFRNEQLKDINREKNEILGIVVHDLRNPISAIRGLAELLPSDNLNADMHPVVEQIILSADRMLDLVKNLLNLNRLETSGISNSLTEFDIAPFVQVIVEQYQQIAGKKNITVQYLPKATHSNIIGDEQAVMQVLDNIISNAVKYSPHGKNIFARVLNNDSFVRIEVQDEGPGISPEDMKKLFGKFARLSARPTGGEHSSGLGLNIAKQMVEAMNGKIWCESEAGKGATFIVELPRE